MAVIPLMVTLCVLSPPKLGGDHCACEKAKLVNGWCDTCQAGYVAGVRMKSAMLYEVLDAHGHDFKTQSITCPSCRKVMEKGGFCDRCDRGFFEKQLYFSKLTWLLAQGKIKHPAELTCSTCRGGLETPTWCSTCRQGMVGNVAYEDKELFEQVKVQFERLQKAIQMIERCEECAARIFSGGTCRRCKITYEDGKEVNQPDEDPPGDG